MLILNLTVTFLNSETEKIGRDAVLLYGTEKRVKDLIGSEEFKEEDKKGIDVPFFNLDSILAATDNFSEANKLGRGGFGPVYKVIFRLSIEGFCLAFGLITCKCWVQKQEHIKNPF